MFTVVQVEQPIRKKAGKVFQKTTAETVREALWKAQVLFNRIPEREIIRKGIRMDIWDDN